MRIDKQMVRDHAGGTTSDVQTMKAIRQEKDNFKPS